MVGSEARVGERSCFHRVQVAERHQVPGIANKHELRHAAVVPEPGGHRGELVLVLAVVLHPLDAAMASPAPRRAVDRNGLAELEPDDSGPDGLDPAGVLVAQGERRLERNHPRLEVVDQVQVRVAHPRTGDTHENLSGGGVGLLDVPDLRVVLPFGELHCVHGGPPPRRGLAHHSSTFRAGWTGPAAAISATGIGRGLGSTGSVPSTPG
ncbi:MAG: hypothetical protein U0P47_07350 [Acidimicrobiales bacterium]